jgi:hypothetical protein
MKYSKHLLTNFSFFTVSGKNWIITSVIVRRNAGLDVKLLINPAVQAVFSAGQLGMSCNILYQLFIYPLQPQEWVRSRNLAVASDIR